MDRIGIMITEGAILSDCNVAGKQDLLVLISKTAARQYGLDADLVYDGLDEREKLGSTGFGGGSAIPHCKYIGLDEPVGVFIRLAKGLDYAAVDENHVDLVFALISPADDGAAHLRALAEASRMLRDPDSCAQLRGASDSAAIYALLSSIRERYAA